MDRPPRIGPHGGMKVTRMIVLVVAVVLVYHWSRSIPEYKVGHRWEAAPGMPEQVERMVRESEEFERQEQARGER